MHQLSKELPSKKKLIKLWMPKFGFIIMYYPSFIKKNPPPLTPQGWLRATTPQKLKNSKIQLKIKIQTSNFGFLVMDHPSFIPEKTIPLDLRGGSREGGLFSTADLQKYKILM